MLPAARPVIYPMYFLFIIQGKGQMFTLKWKSPVGWQQVLIAVPLPRYFQAFIAICKQQSPSQPEMQSSQTGPASFFSRIPWGRGLSSKGFEALK